MAQRNDVAEDHALLSPGLELDVLDGDIVDGEVEVVDGAFDGGVEAAGEDLGQNEKGHPRSEQRLGPIVLGKVIDQNLHFVVG